MAEEWVRIEHPKDGISNVDPEAAPVPGEPGVVTRTSYEAVWYPLGWRLSTRKKTTTKKEND